MQSSIKRKRIKYHLIKRKQINLGLVIQIAMNHSGFDLPIRSDRFIKKVIFRHQK